MQYSVFECACALYIPDLKSFFLNKTGCCLYNDIKRNTLYKFVYNLDSNDLPVLYHKSSSSSEYKKFGNLILSR